MPESPGPPRERGVERVLAGRRIAVTRPREQSRELANGLRALGAEPLLCPAIGVALARDLGPLDDALEQIGAYAWIALTSANAARALSRRLLERRLAIPPHVRVACVGDATAEAAMTELARCDFLSPDQAAASLGETMPVEKYERVLFPRAELAHETLTETLRARGAYVDHPVAYRTVPGDGLIQLVEELRAGALDALTFASGTAARFTAAAIADASRRANEAAAPGAGRAAVFCLGPTTAADARAHGFQVHGVAAPHTIDGLLRAIVEWFAARAEDRS